MNNPGNEAWIKSQEKVHEATLVSQARSKLLRNSMYPAELSVVHAQIATHSHMMVDLSEQCWWKGVFTRGSFERIVAAGAIHGNHNGKAKDYKLQDTDMAIKIIRTFIFHPLLGNEDVELTAKLFAFSRFTFQNWISQPRYVCKWVELVNGLCVKDVLAMIPAIHREHFTNVNGTSKVQLRQCYTAVDQKGVLHITACGLNGSNHTRQKKQKISKKSNG